MKANLFRTSLLAVVAVVAAHAQNNNFRLNVPFDFIVGSQTLPAGQYSVDVRTASSSVALKCVDHAGAAVVIGQPLPISRTEIEPKIVFHRYSNTYFLTQVWANGSGRQLPTTTRERELTARKLNPETTTLVAAH